MCHQAAAKDIIATSFWSKQISSDIIKARNKEWGKSSCSSCACTVPLPSLFKRLLSCPQVTIDCHGLQNLPESKERMGGFLGNPPNGSTISGANEMLQPWTELKRE